ncbi:MAG: YdcF family protein [Candidatus Aenigmatarchaeota archaeon]
MKPAIIHGALVVNGELGIHTKNRVEKAIELFENGEVDCLIPTGKFEARPMAKFLIEEGIPRSAILIEDKSRNTIENLYFSRERFLKRLYCEEVKCVTNCFHRPRVEYDAKIILKGYKVDVVSSIDERIESEIERDIKLERIKMIKDKATLELLYYLYWPEKLKEIYGRTQELLKPYSTFLNNYI